MISYMTLANVFCDQDLEMLPDTKLVVKDIIRIIKIGADSIVSKKNLTRSRVDLKSLTTINPSIEASSLKSSHNTLGSAGEATVIIYNENRYNILELLDSLYKIAINDKMKYTLYEEFGMKKILKEIIMFGNEYEKEFATRLLYQMCFDSNVCAQMGEDNELVDFLNDSEKMPSSSQLLKKNIFGKQSFSYTIFFLCLFLILGQKKTSGILWLNKTRGGLSSYRDDSSESRSSCESSTDRVKEKPRTQPATSQQPQPTELRVKNRSASELITRADLKTSSKKDKKPTKQTSMIETARSSQANINVGGSLPVKPSATIKPITRGGDHEKVQLKQQLARSPVVVAADALDQLVSSNTNSSKSMTITKPAAPRRQSSSITAGHIMISYNKESRDVCLRIKNELENEGHRVWIDVEDIHGSSLESMALAVEGSKCVLICKQNKFIRKLILKKFNFKFYFIYF